MLAWLEVAKTRATHEDMKIKQIQKQLLKSSLFKGAAGSFALKIAATGFTFITSVVLARLLGSEALGAYFYIFSWIGLLSIPAVLGLDNLLVREIAIAKTQSNYGLLKGLLQWTNGVVMLTALALMGFAGLVFYFINPTSSYLLAFYLALVVVPLNALGGLRGGAMKGLKHVVLGTIPEALVSPLLFLILIATSYWVLGSQLSVSLVVGIKVITSLVTFILGTIWLVKLLPRDVNYADAVYRSKSWLGSSLPLMLLGSMQLVKSKTDILMLGAIQGTAAVSIYVVVRYSAEFIIFVQSAVNNVLSPNIASLVAEGRKSDLQRIVSKSSILVFAASCVICLGLIVFSEPILGLFGSDFTSGKTALIILCVGELINTSVGPVGKLLTMSGHENYTATSVTYSAILNVVLNAILIPIWGVNGAAIATAISIVFVNFTLLFFVRKKLGINSAAWSFLINRLSKN